MYIFLMFLLIFSLSEALEIDYRWLKIEVERFYPAKISIYEKEPVFVRFDIKIKENRTGIQKEVLLSFIRMKPVDKNLISSQQERLIHQNEKKLKVKNLLYLRSGDTYLPFELYFDTDPMKGILDENVLNSLSKKMLIKKEQPVYISPLPYSVPYVGSFDIKTGLIDENGTATLKIIIKGKGFPSVPNYTLVVKNGSAKKIAFDIKNEMGYITSVQKYKIVYMDSLEVLPVSFSFFDPYQEKLIEKKTKTEKIEPLKNEKKIQLQELSEEKKIDFYIENFKTLYPEYFEKDQLLKRFFKTADRYKSLILLFFLILILSVIAVSRRYLIKKVPKEVLSVLSIELEYLDDYKKLFRYLPSEEKIQKLYTNEIDNLLFKTKIHKKRGRIFSVETYEGVMNSYQILKRFNRLKDMIIDFYLKKLGEKDRKLAVFYIFVRKNTDILVVLSILIFATLIIQLSAERFPKISDYLNLVNLLVITAGIFSVFLLRKPVIKVRND